MRLPVRLKTRIDTRLPVRLSSAIQAVSRYFKRNEGTTDYISHDLVTADRIVMDVVPVSNNVGLPAGAPDVIADKYQTIDFVYAGSIQYIGRNGTGYFKGIIANVKYYLAGVLIHSWSIDSNSGTETDSVGGLVAALINWNAEDWNLFARDNNDWVRDAVLYSNETNYMPSPYNPENWTGAFNSVKGLITNVISPNPAGRNYIGRVEYLSKYLELNSSVGDTIPSVSSGFVYCGIVVRVLPTDEDVKLFYRIDADGVRLKQAEFYTKTVQSAVAINVTELRDGYRLIMSRLWIGSAEQGVRGRFFISPSSAAGTVLHAQNIFFGLSEGGWPSSIEERLGKA